MAGEQPSQATTASDSLFVAATVLARRARYADATLVLQRALRARHCSHSEALDLHARILAQQGRFREAEAHWLKAKSLGDATHAYDGALQRLWQSGRAPYQRRIAMLLLLTIGVIAWQLFDVIPGLHRRQVGIEQALSGIQSDVVTSRGVTTARDAELASSLANSNQALQEIEALIVKKMDGLPTDALAMEYRDMMVTRIESVKEELKTQIGAMASLTSELSSRVGTLETVFRQLGSSSPSAQQVTEIAQSVSNLEKRVEQLHIGIKELDVRAQLKR